MYILYMCVCVLNNIIVEKTSWINIWLYSSNVKVDIYH